MSAVFDDGDEKTLRRSSLCLKGARHFAESEVSTLLSCRFIAASCLGCLLKVHFLIFMFEQMVYEWALLHYFFLLFF